VKCYHARIEGFIFKFALRIAANLYSSAMAHEFSTSYIADSISLFRYYKTLAERAMEQLSDDQLFVPLDKEDNSIAVILKHMAGNMRSRWTDFLTTDGEKPDRHRDQEFEMAAAVSRAEVLSMWEDGWRVLFAALTPLSDSDLPTKVLIRGEPHSVMQAINRQMAHYSHHIGQIVFLAKHLKGSDWKTLSVPKGKSGAFNQAVAEGKASQR
jgi:uncharacterized damage-inducible protein DinB